MASNNYNQPITVGILKKSLKNLTTKDELKTALKDLTTKDELKTALKDLTTKDELKTALKDLTTKDELKTALKENREEIKKDTLNILGEFTEEVLLPAVEGIVDEKVNTTTNSLRLELKEHIDRRTAETKGDIIAVIKGDRDRDKTFKTKVVEIFDRNKLARSDELVVLSELAR